MNRKKTFYRTVKSIISLGLLLIFWNALGESFQNYGSENKADSDSAQIPQQKNVVNEAFDIDAGKNLFIGITRLDNDGPACLSCHNVTNDNVLSGGLLAKDLTNVYARIGDRGISGVLAAPPFPAMALAYKNQKILEDEANKLIAFLSYVNAVSSTQTVNSSYGIFLYGGGTGLMGVLILIGMIWNKRKKESVKYSIFSRQVKSI